MGLIFRDYSNFVLRFVKVEKMKNRMNTNRQEWILRSVALSTVLILLVLMVRFGQEKPGVPESLLVTQLLDEYHTPKWDCLPSWGWDFHSYTHDNRGFIAFKESLGFKESGGRYGAVNTLGYIGKYQFGEEALKDCGVFDYDAFLSDARLQEEVFAYYTFRNRSRLSRYIEAFENRTVNGTLITESGLLAAAHLAGVGSVKKFLKTDGEFNSEDVYGSSITHYLERFSGYEIGEYVLPDTLNPLDRVHSNATEVLAMKP